MVLAFSLPGTVTAYRGLSAPGPKEGAGGDVREVPLVKAEGNPCGPQGPWAHPLSRAGAGGFLGVVRDAGS